MAPQIIAAAITFIATLAGAVVIFLMMIIAMNGFSGSDAEWGLIAYIGAATATIVLMSTAAVFLVRRLVRKQFSAIGAVAIAVPTFSVVGIVAEIVLSLIGIGIAEFVRVNY